MSHSERSVAPQGGVKESPLTPSPGAPLFTCPVCRVAELTTRTGASLRAWQFAKFVFHLSCEGKAVRA